MMMMMMNFKRKGLLTLGGKTNLKHHLSDFIAKAV